MHEIIALQLGQRANHVATHFWNTQESYFTYDSAKAPSPVDHDVHFRPGITAKGEETFTPRTLIYDLKNGFGGLRKWGGLYEQQTLAEGQDVDESKDILWNGNVVLQTDPRISQSSYQHALDIGETGTEKLTTETVRYWSDFNRVFYHPRSIVQINDYELGSTLLPFEKWESGEELYLTLDRDSDLLDRDVRPWAEECDQMQGVQVFASADDAWGGFTARYVEAIRDEFGKLPVWCWGVEEAEGRGPKAKQMVRTWNAARTTNEMASQASLYIPVSVPIRNLPQYLRLDSDSLWQTSALLSAAVESMTLPSRLRLKNGKKGLLGDIESALNVNGNQRIAQLECSASDPEAKQNYRVNGHGVNDDRLKDVTVEEDGDEIIKSDLDISLSSCDGVLSSSFTNLRTGSNHIFGAVESLRGGQEASEEEGVFEDDISYARKRRRFAGLTVVERYQSPLQYPLLDSFPDIFTLGPNLKTLEIRSSLSTTSRMSSRVKALQKAISRMGSVDEREALVTGLGEIGEAYEEGWDGGSDEGSDE